MNAALRPCPTAGKAWASALAALLGFAACACSPTSAQARHATAARRAGHESTWASMTWEQKHDVMTFVVLPNMARLFQRFEEKPYPDMTCRTCHGDDGEKIGYRMPNDLTALDPGDLPKTSAMARFMWHAVTPRMADMLDDPPGFSCFNCHVKKP